MAHYFLHKRDLEPGDFLAPEFDIDGDTEIFVSINPGDAIVVVGDKYDWYGMFLKDYPAVDRALVRVWNAAYMEWMNVSVDAYRIVLLQAASAITATEAAAIA